MIGGIDVISIAFVALIVLLYLVITRPFKGGSK